jgi:DNA-binding transcriptional ArsR family regulator
LEDRSWCVCELAEHLGLNKSITSKHLSLLQSQGIIGMKKEGTRVNCNLKMRCVMDMVRCAMAEEADRKD